MMPRSCSLALALFGLWPAPALLAQTAEALTLATVLERGAKLVAQPPRVLWLPNGHEATVVLPAQEGTEALHALRDGQPVQPPITTAAAVWAALGEPAAAGRPLPACRWLDATTLRIEHGAALWHWQPGQERATAVLRWAEPDAGDTPQHSIAPDDQHTAYVRQRQLWLQSRAGRLRQLTFDGSADLVYGGAAHRAEFGIDRGLFWSADGRWLAFYREDQRGIAPYPYQDLQSLPPKPVAGRYPMAGRPHGRVQVGICDTADGSLCWLEADPDEDVYWTNLAFGPGPSLVVARVSRRQEDLELVRYDLRTGRRLSTLWTEHDAKWLEPEHPPTFLPDGRFLWWSYAEGYRHLFLHGPDGARLHQVTKGAFDVQTLLGLSPDLGTVWFQASGEDPRQLHLFAAPLASGEVRQLTQERGTHRAELAPDASAAALVWSNLETRPSTRLLDLQSGAVTPLPAPNDPLGGFALPAQRLFQIAAEDDTVLYGHLALPPNLAEGQKCPVLLYVYGGPHVQLVTDQWLGGAPLWLQALAAEGYAVCRLDNRGTPNRGLPFAQAIHRRLGTLEVQDQLRAVAWLAEQPFVDGSRIGVHGWSYGGYLTLRLLLAAPTTFACGISGAPVTDWAMYETGYGERYMDTPAENAEGYQQSSCLPLAGRLQKPLLLVHGTDDRTVMWSHSLAFVDRCIDAGVPLDYFPYPMQRHGLTGRDRQHFLKLLRDWLGKHLQPAAK
ncbi:MAG: S9 family peptidase [Planctomycetes bacterium]|nr:S9 family peptidase [Planctomycetota bacterium]